MHVFYFLIYNFLTFMKKAFQFSMKNLPEVGSEFCREDGLVDLAKIQLPDVELKSHPKILVVEFLVLVSVVAKRVAEGDLLRVMPRHQHVGFADAEGFAVQLLPEQLNADRGIEVLERAFRQG